MVEGYDSSVRGKVSLGIFHCYTALDGAATYYLMMYNKEKEELDSAYDGTCILQFMSKAYRVEYLIGRDHLFKCGPASNANLCLDDVYSGDFFSHGVFDL